MSPDILIFNALRKQRHTNQYLGNTENMESKKILNDVTRGKNNPIYRTSLTIADQVSYKEPQGGRSSR